MNRITINVNGQNFDMLRVEGGHFIMGATVEQHGEEWGNETPPHDVSLETYFLSETVVTQALWQAVMEDAEDNVPDMPQTGKSWKECQTFISKLSKLTGRRFRLPTESEWEYAARGGNMTHGFKYAGSNNLDAVAWFDMNSGGAIHPVKRKQPNELGLYDMSGNVWEWCNDWYDEYEEREDEEDVVIQQNPKGPARGSQKVVRGASSSHYGRSCRVSCRMGLEPEGKNYASTGFRLAFDERYASMQLSSEPFEEEPEDKFDSEPIKDSLFDRQQADEQPVKETKKGGNNGKGHYWGTSEGGSSGKKKRLPLIIAAGVALIVILFLVFGGGGDEPELTQPSQPSETTVDQPKDNPKEKPSKKKNVKADITRNINDAVALFNDNQLTQNKWVTYDPMIGNLSQGWRNLLAAESDNKTIQSSDPDTYDSNARQIQELKQNYLSHVKSVYDAEQDNLRGLMKDPGKYKAEIEQGKARIMQIEQFAGINELK